MMDADTFSKLVTALTEWRPVPDQSPFDLSGLHPGDFLNKPLGTLGKLEHSGGAEGGAAAGSPFLGTIAPTTSFQGGYSLPAVDNEQVPMDDYDPLESFTFWDGETFYCNQDLDPCCSTSPNVPDESEMLELQDYLMSENVMARDDLAHIDDTDLIRSNPTLAELNSCGDTLIDCSAESSFLSEDSGYLLSPELLSKSVPINECGNFMNPATTMMANSGFYMNSVSIPVSNFPEPKSNSLLSSSCPVSSRTLSCPQYLTTCDERLLLCPQNSPASESFVPKQEAFGAERPLMLPRPSKSTAFGKRFRATSSLPRSSPLEVVATCSSPGIKSESPASSCGSRSAERTLSGFSALSLSNDDESGSFFDSDHDDDDGDDDGFSSDEDQYQYDSDDSFSTSWPPSKAAKVQPRRNRFFWQYNLQSRGVKTQNLIPLSEEGNPYVLNDVKDPVFSEDCTLPVKHSGKARKGDGNDLTPNPRKLHSIGMELKKLNKLICNLNPAPDFVVQGKPLSRKEKNKLASRVCRLKKKAQHEANKIKLFGLQQEHKRLLTILIELKRLIGYKIEHFQETKNMPCFQKIENYLVLHEPEKVAGCTTDFVNVVLDKVAKGNDDGGLGKM